MTAAAFDAAFAVAQADPAAIPTSDVPDLNTALYAGDPTRADQSAQRLLARPDPAARAILRDALANFGNYTVQAAAARALAGHPTEDPTLITPLFALMNPASNNELLESAGRALTAFKADENVRSQLLTLATGRDERVRVVAIRTAGTFVDQRIAETLVRLTDLTANPPRVVTAANNALAYLTGLPSSTNWRTWWDANRGKTSTQFAADLSRDRAIRYDLARLRFDALQDEFTRLLNALYERTPDDQKAELLLRHLRSPDAAVRTAAASLANQEALNGIAPPSVKDQLRLLVGDASPEVRRAAARALATINDPKAVVPLLTQLNQETESSVRAAIAAALKPTQDERAIPALLDLLNDSSPETVQIAGDTLGDLLNGLRASNPTLADGAAARLMQIIKTRTTPQSNIALRASLVTALGKLQSTAVARDLLDMLSSPAEDPVVRRELLAAVGAYHKSNFTDAITGWMDDQDYQTRLAAVRAAGESADTFSLVQDKLAARIDPKIERQADVRDAAWKVLVKLFPTAPAGQLNSWESKPLLRDDAPKRIVVLQALRDLATRDGDPDQAAARNQQIGDTALGAKRYDEAVVALQAAFTYAKDNKKTIEILADSLMQAYLGSRQYPQAIDFYQKLVQQNKNFQGLGGRFSFEADRLVRENEFALATQLIDLSLKINNPPLAARFVEQLQRSSAVVKARNNQQNQTPSPPVEPLQAMGSSRNDRRAS